MKRSLLLNEIQKLRDDEKVSHNIKDMFFQERNFRILDSLKYTLLEQLA
jgi:hypothetical protein